MIQFALALIVSLAAILPAEQRQLDDYDRNVTTGIEIGHKIPPFRAIDQNGNRLDFGRIKGPRGAVLSFQRSADW